MKTAPVKITKKCINDIVPSLLVLHNAMPQTTVSEYILKNNFLQFILRIRNRATKINHKTINEEVTVKIPLHEFLSMQHALGFFSEEITSNDHLNLTMHRIHDEIHKYIEDTKEFSNLKIEIA